MYRLLALGLAVSLVGTGPACTGNRPVVGSSPALARATEENNSTHPRDLESQSPGCTGIVFGFDVRGRRVNGKFVPNPDSDLHPIIMKISPGSPAAKAGLAVDDVILTVNGKDVSPKTNGEKVTVEGGMLLGKPEAGVTYIYRIRRGDTEFEVPITAVACPPDTSASTRS